MICLLNCQCLNRKKDKKSSCSNHHRSLLLTGTSEIHQTSETFKTAKIQNLQEKSSMKIPSLGEIGNNHQSHKILSSHKTSKSFRIHKWMWIWQQLITFSIKPPLNKLKSNSHNIHISNHKWRHKPSSLILRHKTLSISEIWSTLTSNNFSAWTSKSTIASDSLTMSPNS